MALVLVILKICSAISFCHQQCSKKALPTEIIFTIYMFCWVSQNLLNIIVTVKNRRAKNKPFKTLRKENLVEFGFRLPSAYDNRPLSFEEFEKKLGQVVFVSATPAAYEREHSSQTVEQLIRPTGLVDPEIEVRPVDGQVDDLMGEIRQRAERGERVLVTTLTTKMAEDLTEFFAQNLIRVKYIHHNVETIERMEIIRDLRLGLFDVLVGINLLREGLDIPEVSLVADRKSVV